MDVYGNNLLTCLNNQRDNEIEKWKNLRLLNNEYLEIAEKHTITHYKYIIDSVNRVIPKDINGQKAIETHSDFLEYMDKKTFCRKWIKLNNRHMINRIKFYIDNLKYSNTIAMKKQTQNKEYVFNKLIDLLNEKKLKPDFINYNSTEGKINSITILHKNKNTLIYEIDDV